MSLSEIYKKALKEFNLAVKDEHISAIYFISSGAEWSARNVINDSILRVDGKLVCERLFNNRKVINNGVIEVGGFDA